MRKLPPAACNLFHWREHRWPDLSVDFEKKQTSSLAVRSSERNRRASRDARGMAWSWKISVEFVHRESSARLSRLGRRALLNGPHLGPPGRRWRKVSYESVAVGESNIPPAHQYHIFAIPPSFPTMAEEGRSPTFLPVRGADLLVRSPMQYAKKTHSWYEFARALDGTGKTL